MEPYTKEQRKEKRRNEAGSAEVMSYELNICNGITVISTQVMFSLKSQPESLAALPPLTSSSKTVLGRLPRSTRT